MQCFFALGITLIRCISLEAKTTLFVGQNSNTKLYSLWDGWSIAFFFHEQPLVNKVILINTVWHCAHCTTQGWQLKQQVAPHIRTK